MAAVLQMMQRVLKGRLLGQTGVASDEEVMKLRGAQPREAAAR